MRRCLAVTKKTGKPCASTWVAQGDLYCPAHRSLRAGKLASGLSKDSRRHSFTTPPKLTDRASAIAFCEWLLKATVRKELAPRKLHLLRESFKDWLSLSGISLQVPKAPRPTKARTPTSTFALTPDDEQPE